MDTKNCTFPPTRRLQKGSLLALILLLLWPPLIVVYGQPSPRVVEASSPDFSLFSVRVVEQHRLLLGDAAPHLREQAMQNIIDYNRDAPGTYDWSKVGSALVRIYQNDPDPQLRIMAVSAIYTMGDKRSIDAMNRHNWFLRDAHAQRRLPYTPSRAERISDHAVRMYYHTANIQRADERIQRRIDRHTARALQHNERAQELSSRLSPENKP